MFQKGASLLLALISITLLSGIFVTLSRLSLILRERLQLPTKSKELQIQSDRDLRNVLTSADVGRLPSRSRLMFGPLKQSLLLQRPLSVLTSIDYDRLFDRFDHCSLMPSLSLQSTSHLAPTSCQSPDEISGNLIIDGNLEAHGRLTTASPSLIGSLGVVHFGKEWSVDHDTIVISVGDIVLSSISTTGSVRVSLFSARGKVTLGAIRGAGLRLHVESQQGNDLPIHIPQDELLLPPYLKDLEILGISTP